MKKTEFAVLISLVITVIFSSFVGIEKQCENLHENVVRLHIIAENDTEKAQEIKLKVRDKLLENSKELFSGATNKQTALLKINENLGKIKEICKQTLLENNCDSQVTVGVEKMFFNLKNYETFVMPSGIYDALKITIGDGGGKNWWCVMFPPMCLSACIDRETLTQTLGEDGGEFIEKTPKYVARFKILEYIEKLFTKAPKYEK